MRSLACVACFWVGFWFLQSDTSQFRFLFLAWVRIDVFFCWLFGALGGDVVEYVAFLVLVEVLVFCCWLLGDVLDF